MSALFSLVRAVEEGRLTDDQRTALVRLLVVLDAAPEVDPAPRAPWSAVVLAYRVLAELPGGGSSPATVIPLRPCPGAGR